MPALTPVVTHGDTARPGRPARVPGPRSVAWLVVATLAYVSLVPFYYLQPLYLGTSLPPFSAARYLPWGSGVLLLLLTVVRRWPGRMPWVRTPLDWWLLALVGVGLVSVIGAEYPEVGLAKWVYYNLTGIAWCWALAQVLPQQGEAARLARRLSLVFVVTVMYTFCCYILGADWVWGQTQSQNNPNYIGTVYRATGPFGNPVSTGAYLVLTIPLMVWLACSAPRRTVRLAMGLVAVLALYTAAMTQSRGAWLALAGVSATVAGHAAWRRPHRLAWRQRLALLASLLLAWPVFTVLSVHTGASQWLETRGSMLSDRAALLAPSALPTSESFRLAQYRTTARVLRAHPLLGVGLGNFTRVFDTYRDASTPSRFQYPARTTENMLLMLAVETGLVGLACGVGFFAALGAVCWRLYCRLPSGEDRGLTLACLAALGGALLNMQVWDALCDPTIRLLFWTIVGVVLALDRATPPLCHRGAS